MYLHILDNSKLFKCNAQCISCNEKYDKYNGCSDDDVSEHLKSRVQSLICSKMPTNELDNYDEIVIDQYPISNVSTFYSVVQINSIDEIKMLFCKVFIKIGYEGSNIIFVLCLTYANIRIRSLKKR